MKTKGSSRDVLLSFDVEEAFQVENLRQRYPREAWGDQPMRAFRIVSLLLDLLEEFNAKATFFVLGWVAERDPELVRRVVAAGHEVASHGISHVRPTELTDEAFREELVQSKRFLETLAQQPIHGFRAPSFAVDDHHVEMIAHAGYRYDSSYQPFGRHPRYGRLRQLGETVRPGLHRVHPNLFEVELPVTQFRSLELPVSGGAYFRFYPRSVFQLLARKRLKSHGFLPLYFHPWEFDSLQPKMNGVPWRTRLRHSHNTSRGLRRLRNLLGDLQRHGAEFITYRTFLDGAAAVGGRSAVPRVEQPNLRGRSAVRGKQHE